MLKFPKLRSGFPIIDQQWEKLCTLIQKYIEHHPMTNDNGTAVTKGQILYPSGDRTASLAQADAAATSEWCGVVDTPSAADGTKFDMATANVQLVRFENSLTPKAGEKCYLSATVAGSGRNSEPAAGYSIVVGLIVDASPYVTVTNPFCHVLLGRCCVPQEVQA
jgi:hypothetical protein